MTGPRRRRACREHRAALVELAARRDGGQDLRHALDHVERCRDCEAELAGTALVIHALRRFHDETRRAEPAPDGWPRLRTRLVGARREPSRLLSGLPGIALSVGLCAAIVGPGVLGGGGSAGVHNEAPRGAPPRYLVFEQGRDRALAARLLPEPTPGRPLPGARNASPPPAAGLPRPAR